MNLLIMDHLVVVRSTRTKESTNNEFTDNGLSTDKKKSTDSEVRKSIDGTCKPSVKVDLCMGVVKPLGAQ